MMWKKSAWARTVTCCVWHHSYNATRSPRLKPPVITLYRYRVGAADVHTKVFKCQAIEFDCMRTTIIGYRHTLGSMKIFESLWKIKNWVRLWHSRNIGQKDVKTYRYGYNNYHKFQTSWNINYRKSKNKYCLQ